MYDRGDGVKRDRAKAKELYRQAESAGVAGIYEEAQRAGVAGPIKPKLGVMHEHGDGVKTVVLMSALILSILILIFILYQLRGVLPDLYLFWGLLLLGYFRFFHDGLQI